jgi:formylmethanofuran dehydrogenase subunit B
VPLRRESNALGGENVLAWQSGYPSAVSFAQGHPRFAPGELGAARLLGRGAVDAALVVASDPLEHLPPQAAERLRRIPTVVVDSRVTATAAASRVAFLTGAYGIHHEGTVHRMDGVPIPLAAPLPSERPGDEQVLAAIAARVAEQGR